MEKSLKKIYLEEKAQIIAEKARESERQLLENKAFLLILEDIDQGKLSALVQQVDNIENLINPVRDALPSLAQAADAAKEELTKELSGGIGRAVSNFFKIAKPVSKVASFLSAVRKGFSQIPTIIKFLKKGGEIDKTERMSQLLGNSREQAINILNKAFVPTGLLAGLKGIVGSGTPYVENSYQLAQELLALPYQDLERLGTQGASIQVPIGQDDAAQMVKAAEKNQPTQGQVPQTAAPTPAEPAQPAAPEATKTGQKAPVTRTELNNVVRGNVGTVLNKMKTSLSKDEKTQLMVSVSDAITDFLMRKLKS